MQTSAYSLCCYGAQTCSPLLGRPRFNLTAALLWRNQFAPSLAASAWAVRVANEATLQYYRSPHFIDPADQPDAPPEVPQHRTPAVLSPWSSRIDTYEPAKTTTGENDDRPCTDTPPLEREYGPPPPPVRITPGAPGQLLDLFA
jgi:hypothetical protein